jgi:outer membrane lipoprotein-sorting protein
MKQAAASFGAALLSAFFLCGCPVSPPPSQFPSANDALARMHATYYCSRGIQGEAKLEYFGEKGRVRGNVLYMAALPESLRFDVYSPFGVTLSTLTSDGKDFALYDLKEKEFLQGPANACNVARFTQVPVPPFALAELLRGEAPVLVHDPNQASIKWGGSDGYVIEVQSTRSATEEIHLEPTHDDWNLPWEKQRVIVTEVRVVQKGYELYEADLADHQVAHTAKESKDPDDPTALVIPPSGPACNAEIPRRLRILTPDTDQELVLHNKDVSHNPPLAPGVFQQQARRGVTVRYAACSP